MNSQSSDKQINIASIVLAGGKGTRLYPLTLHHSKPAVSYGGRYRLIDVPISNSLNSNIRQIFVLGQYLTAELQHHLSQTYQFDRFFPGMLDMLTPEELPTGEKIWFDGTADAIRKSLKKILAAPVDYFLILSGDQLYNIDFQSMFEFAKEKDANLTIASLPVNETDAKRMGLLKISNDGYVTDFLEKPQSKDALHPFMLPRRILGEGEENPRYLGSMGIYIFKRQALIQLLKEDSREDFGKHLIPTEIKKGRTAAFLYDGYWEDIGTIESFYKANLALTGAYYTGLKMYDEKNPVYTHVNHLPGAKIKDTLVSGSIICEGSIVNAKAITDSIVGIRSVIRKGTVINNSVIMGNNYYFAPKHRALPAHFEIGENCLFDKVIVDEHVFIGNNVKLINQQKLQNYDSEILYVRDGIIVIPAGSHIPDNFVF